MKETSIRKKLLSYAAFYALLLTAIFRFFYCFPTPKSPLSLSTGVVEEEEGGCDYTDGKWVHDKVGPMYNSTTCSTTIKDGQNCGTHGRPDKGYLYWRWKPNKCPLIPRFDPTTFLRLTKDRHVAFVGDSLARNQLESLLCLLSSVNPRLIYTNGQDNKFRRWHFASPHNVTVSVYWSPFLVKGLEKSPETPYNRLYLDSVNPVWAKDLHQIDMLVLSIGHWFLHPALFYYGDSLLGCHSCNHNNHSTTEVGFYDVFGMAFNTTLKLLANTGRRIHVIVTTFSPAHFQGDWDSIDACSKTKPFDKENDKTLQGMDYEMRQRQMQQVISANQSKGFHLQALDVTKLALLRPDGHPGPYMYPFPFANGKPERVPNDCVHWCLPGPIDTWNEIMLHIMKRWNF